MSSKSEDLIISDSSSIDDLDHEDVSQQTLSMSEQTDPAVDVREFNEDLIARGRRHLEQLERMQRALDQQEHIAERLNQMVDHLEFRVNGGEERRRMHQKLIAVLFFMMVSFIGAIFMDIKIVDVVPLAAGLLILVMTMYSR